MISKLFNNYNKLIFDNTLIVPHIKVLRYYNKEYLGWCGILEDHTLELCLNTKAIRTKEQYQNTLIHEMVHVWQYQNGLIMDHGLSFEQWIKPIQLLTGIKISEFA